MATKYRQCLSDIMAMIHLQLDKKRDKSFRRLGKSIFHFLFDENFQWNMFDMLKMIEY